MSAPNTPESPAAKTLRVLEEIAASNNAILAELRTLNHRLMLNQENGISSVELEQLANGSVRPKVKSYNPDLVAGYKEAASIVNLARAEFNKP